MNAVSLLLRLLSIVIMAAFGVGFAYVGTLGFGQMPQNLIHVFWTMVGLGIVMLSSVQLISTLIALCKWVAFEQDQTSEGLS